jgi:hypothetical protein
MNPARQFLHLFLKDIRRHALEIGLVLLLNLGLALALTETWEESLTFDEFGMMFGDAAQLLLVLTWCVLIGRVVQDDGVAGKAPYWLTRPYNRPMLLASKLAFVLLFIHLPLFLSHLAIVSGSGLPLSFAQMLVDQVVLAACISLPAMTLAALTTTFSRFVFGGVAATGVLMFAVAAVDPWSSRFVIGAFPSSPGSYFVLATALAILVSITGVALACQYRWRATLRVAVTSVVALSLLGLVLLTLPTTFVMRARAAVVRPATVATTIRFRAGAEPRIVNVNPEDIPQIRLVLLPIDLTDTGESTLFTYKVDIRGAAGSELERRCRRELAGPADVTFRIRLPEGRDRLGAFHRRDCNL